jgi:hypothetical protein
MYRLKPSGLVENGNSCGLYRKTDAPTGAESEAEPMSEERKVICPCGKEMMLMGDNGTHGPAFKVYPAPQNAKWFNYICECGWSSPTAEGRTAAYAAAMKRPPNLPLTREQLRTMPEHTPVFIAAENWILLESSESALLDYDAGSATGCMYFATLPSPADIEAARKERAE